MSALIGSIGAQEREFYRHGSILITNARFVVGSQTYAMQGITSMRQARKDPSRTGPVLLALLGLTLMWIGIADFGDRWGLALFGLASIGLAVLVWIRAKIILTVYLQTSAGEQAAYQSDDPAQFFPVTDALSQALASR